jgi:hypothetical protein
MKKQSIKVSLIAVKNIIVVTYCSKRHRISLSLIAVNETPLITQPYIIQWVSPLSKKTKEQ